MKGFKKMSYKKDIETILNIDNIKFYINFLDISASKMSFYCLIDNLQKDNLISEKTSKNIYLSMNKKTKNAFIVCGSYKKRI